MKNNKLDIKSLTLDELRDWFIEIGEKSFHANQVYRWLYVQKVDSFEDMTNISKSLRDKLVEKAYISTFEIDKIDHSKDGTIKIRFKLFDDNKIESVLIPDKKRITICISSQVGCAMGCKFCFTAKMGIIRDLEVSEIINQVLLSQSILNSDSYISNIVFMGMGEPLKNTDNVIKAVNILLDNRGLNFAKKRLTVSTSGVLPNIIRLKKETKARLAISLNASNDFTRTKIMPINKKWNIKELIETLKNLELENREYITLEYVLIKNLNDSISDAKKLVALLKNLSSFKVNLIPFNEHEGVEFKRPDKKTIKSFHTYLYQNNIDVLERVSRGDDIGAACGQLVVPEILKKSLRC